MTGSATPPFYEDAARFNSELTALRARRHQGQLIDRRAFRPRGQQDHAADDLAGIEIAKRDV